jgi:hypothetical protein
LYSCVICHYDTVTVLVTGDPAPVHSSVAAVREVPSNAPTKIPEDVVPPNIFGAKNINY